jgi:ubiquinone/menaquinone biosynthesis C-methylase UbiE
LIASEFGSVTGVDVSPRMIETARMNNPTVRYLLSKDDELPLADEEFDMAFAICVFHHIGRQQRAEFTREVMRVVRRGGLMAILEHNPLNPLTRLVVSRCDFDEGVELLGLREVRRLISAASATPVESRYILFLPWQGEALRRIEDSLGWLPLGAQYVVAGQRD